jgi:hypothetical protein
VDLGGLNDVMDCIFDGGLKGGRGAALDQRHSELVIHDRLLLGGEDTIGLETA